MKSVSKTFLKLIISVLDILSTDTSSFHLYLSPIPSVMFSLLLPGRRKTNEITLLLLKKDTLVVGLKSYMSLPYSTFSLLLNFFYRFRCFNKPILFLFAGVVFRATADCFPLFSNFIVILSFEEKAEETANEILLPQRLLLIILKRKSEKKEKKKIKGRGRIKRQTAGQTENDLAEKKSL